jgi:hypothetical protein
VSFCQDESPIYYIEGGAAPSGTTSSVFEIPIGKNSQALSRRAGFRSRPRWSLLVRQRQEAADRQAAAKGHQNEKASDRASLPRHSCPNSDDWCKNCSTVSGQLSMIYRPSFNFAFLYKWDNGNIPKIAAPDVRRGGPYDESSCYCRRGM